MAAKISQGYNKDFYAWALHNAKLIRQGKFAEVDFEHVAEEIESMGISEKRELLNRLAKLIAHLLKWQYQPARRGKSWKSTIKGQRIEIQDLLEDSPSLKHELDLRLARAYKKAVFDAVAETGLDESIFPKQCPYSLIECLDEQFFLE
jgi:vacuolar-type H+-ATPase subunit C/Vma6